MSRKTLFLFCAFFHVSISFSDLKNPDFKVSDTTLCVEETGVLQNASTVNADPSKVADASKIVAV